MIRKTTKKLMQQVVAYLIGGGLFFWSGYATFFILDQGFGLSIGWAKTGANIVGVTVNFIVQRFFAFTAKHPSKHIGRVTWRFLLITGINFYIDYLIVRGLKDIFDITPYIGQFVSAGFFTLWNFYWYKYWVFKAPLRHQPKHIRRASRRVTKKYA